jgi:hypothetical protein
LIRVDVDKNSTNVVDHALVMTMDLNPHVYDKNKKKVKVDIDFKKIEKGIGKIFDESFAVPFKFKFNHERMYYLDCGYAQSR